MQTHAQQAQTLVEALPYIQKFTGKTIVVKYGGNAMISDELRQAVMKDIILLHLVGIRVVVVHGGGPEINDMLKKIGHQSKFVDGLRYTDEITMDVVQSVLCGKVNKNLVAQLNRLGGQAVGFCGMDGELFQAECLDEKYGMVGEITKVDPKVLLTLLDADFVPVVSPIALGEDGAGLNCNADDAARAVAEALGKTLSEATGKQIEAMIYGDGCFKDPVGMIWEMADPQCCPGFTAGLDGTPNELKLKNIADGEYSELKGAELKAAVEEKIRNKQQGSLVGNMASMGTTPRRIVDLLGSLCDLTSGSGDKGTPIIYIQGYFDNFIDE